jgi:5-methylcytosine-specific restriction endonuclease McrA
LPTAPCSSCGTLLITVKASRPSPTCQPCRRLSKAQTCAGCGCPFERSHANATYCSRACANQSRARLTRSADDPRVRRSQREAAAPGLSRAQRDSLRKMWIRQQRTCTYCNAPATTVDHVVPLVRGGTNHEGNLTPACKRCNSAKQALLIIEWRTSKRLGPNSRPVAWTHKPKPPRVEKPKQHKPSAICYVCFEVYCLTRSNRITCGGADHLLAQTRNVEMNEQVRPVFPI